MRLFFAPLLVMFLVGCATPKAVLGLRKESRAMNSEIKSLKLELILLKDDHIFDTKRFMREEKNLRVTISEEGGKIEGHNKRLLTLEAYNETHDKRCPQPYIKGIVYGD